MKVLFDESKTTEDNYRYKVNQGGDLDIRVSNYLCDRHAHVVLRLRLYYGGAGLVTDKLLKQLFLAVAVSFALPLALEICKVIL